MYDIWRYQGSEEQANDELKQEFIHEIPYEKTQYPYKIEGGICYVSYDMV